MKKTSLSGSAIFMYCIIAITAISAFVCFFCYYENICRTPAALWTGVSCFTVMYHLWMRIIMGNVTKLFRIDFRQRWFCEHSFEKKIYRALNVKKWKGKVPTYNPELFSLKDYSLEDVANTMSKAETDHWINELISLSTLLFAVFWGAFPVFLITAVFAMLFDAQFIAIQRYNRPRIIRLLEKEKNKVKKDEAVSCSA